MGQDTKILIALDAVAFCLLAYPGIFSGLSNDGKQGAASIFFGSSCCQFTTLLIFAGVEAAKILRKEPTLFIPGMCRGLNLFTSQNCYSL